MEFKKVIQKRRTTRQFTGAPVTEEQIKRIIQAGITAPSFDHKRKWNFIAVMSEAAKAKVTDCIDPLPCKDTPPENPVQEMIQIAFPKQKSMFAEAGCILLPLYKRETQIMTEVGPRRLMDFAEIWCVIENIFLATTDEGLGCSMRIPTEGQPEKILEALGCPSGYQLPCIIGIGHIAEGAEYPEQIYPDLAECVHWENW